MTTNRNLTNQFEKYTIFKQQGLRKKAMEELDLLILMIKETTTDITDEFCYMVSDLYFNKDETRLPQPLAKEIIYPYLKKEVDNKSSIHMRWMFACIRQHYKLDEKNEYYGSIDILNDSFDLNPKDPKTVKLIFKLFNEDLLYATHHLPEHMLLDFKDVQELYDEINTFIQKLKDNNLEVPNINHFLDYKIEIETYFQKDIVFDV